MLTFCNAMLSCLRLISLTLVLVSAMSAHSGTLECEFLLKKGGNASNSAGSAQPKFNVDPTMVATYTSPSADDYSSPLSVYLNKLIDFDTEEKGLFLKMRNPRGSNPYGPSKSVYVLQFSDIKTLNEIYLGTAKTEDFLEYFHVTLHEITGSLTRKNETDGIFLSNYKYHFISTRLAPDKVDELILQPLKAKAATWLSSQFQNIQPVDQRHDPEFWAQWLNTNLRTARGDDLYDSFFQLNLIRTNQVGLSYETWRRSAVQRRTLLERKAKLKKIVFYDLLTAMQRFISRNQGGPEGFNEWLKLRRAADLYEPALRYFADLQFADFFPVEDRFSESILQKSPVYFKHQRRINPFGGPRLSWMVERRLTFANAEGAGLIFATDVASLGALGRYFQDRWIAQGARREQLPSVYEESAKYMDRAYQQIYRKLRIIFRGNQHQVTAYRQEGDEVVWFLPPTASPAQQSQLDQLLEEIKNSEYPLTADGKLQFRIHVSGLEKIEKTKDLMSFLLAYNEVQHRMNLSKLAPAPSTKSGGSAAPSPAAASGE